ncbi:MAG: carboxy-S-adenosyl-L-methionine synthase CmoA, partial [Pseudomonadota bacterium]
RSALENVLVRESLADHRTRLENAGFRQVEQWFQCFNFASLVAFK